MHELRALVWYVEDWQRNVLVRQSALDSTALYSAKELPSENTGATAKAAEALMTWLGSKPSSRQLATSALCAALTDDLKLIILSRSKTFQDLDTIQQTDFASATSVTITESTAASLISFMADTLRRKAIDKAAGAERERIRRQRVDGKSCGHTGGSLNTGSDVALAVGQPITDAAKEWEGWGTALKPAAEFICVARKPLSEKNVAENVLKHGTGGLNIDACRIPGPKGSGVWGSSNKHCQAGRTLNQSPEGEEYRSQSHPAGRWPSNLIHDGSEEVVGLFPITTSGRGPIKRRASSKNWSGQWKGTESQEVYGDSGSAARFFYCAKPSRSERKRSKHPTMKPLALMRHLVRLVSRPGYIILDPFLGSGTTALACIEEGRRFIGLELDLQYCQDARKAIMDAGTRLRLEDKIK